MVHRVPGRCPTCGGEATVYPKPDEQFRGHIYCEEDDWGHIHRDRIAVNRFIETDGGAPDE